MIKLIKLLENSRVNETAEGEKSRSFSSDMAQCKEWEEGRMEVILKNMEGSIQLNSIVDDNTIKDSKGLQLAAVDNPPYVKKVKTDGHQLVGNSLVVVEASNTMRDAPQGYNTPTFVAEDGVDSNVKQYYDFDNDGSDDEPLKRSYKKRLEQWRQELFRKMK